MGYFADVAAALMGRPDTAVTMDEGAAYIALVMAIYKSQRDGTRIALPIAKDACF